MRKLLPALSKDEAGALPCCLCRMHLLSCFVTSLPTVHLPPREDFCVVWGFSLLSLLITVLSMESLSTWRFHRHPVRCQLILRC